MVNTSSALLAQPKPFVDNICIQQYANARVDLLSTAKF